MDNTYQGLDDAIIARLNDGLMNGGATFTQLEYSLRDMANEISKPDRWGQKTGWRVIDRRLQALRKKGLIKFDRKTGWSVA